MDQVITLPEIAELEQVDRVVEVVNKITGLEVLLRTRTPLSEIESANWQYCLQLGLLWAFC